MPRLRQSVPGYCKHRASGQAVVRLSGEDFYLGPHGTKASRMAYDRAVFEWLARGRQPTQPAEGEAVFTVVELLALFVDHAELYYRKNGKPTNEVRMIKRAVKIVRELYGFTPAAEFGPAKLEAVQQAMIRVGWSRKNINKQIGRVVRAFAWGVAKELIPKNAAVALRELPGLKAGRTEARETAPVMPVSEATVDLTLHHLPPIVADLVRLQRLAGCRPAEVCIIRPCDVDTTKPVWEYRPESHKTQHHGRERVIFIGPRGQAILRPYLLRDKAAYCFSPADGERKRRETRHEQRTTPLSCGNRPGTNRSKKPKRAAGERYTTWSYNRAIARACEMAFGMPDELRKAGKGETAEHKAERLKLASQWRETNCWSPNQLRHSAATEIRKRFGLEAAQATMGHAKADVTEIYAERDRAKAAEVMALVG